MGDCEAIVITARDWFQCAAGLCRRWPMQLPALHCPTTATRLRSPRAHALTAPPLPLPRVRVEIQFAIHSQVWMNEVC